jgi:hypothetical protein
MAKRQTSIAVPDEVVVSKIYRIRGLNVMLDRDLAELYGIETRRLKEQVRRNMARFPEDFMFELSKVELEDWRSQFATSNSEVMGLRYPPFAFTEHGVLMLSSVLNTERAIEVNIRIMRIYTRLKEMMHAHRDILVQLEEMRGKMVGQDERIDLIFEYLKQLEQARHEETEFRERRPIGYRRHQG